MLAKILARRRNSIFSIDFSNVERKIQLPFRRKRLISGRQSKSAAVAAFLCINVTILNEGDSHV